MSVTDMDRWVRTPAEVAVARLDQVRRVLAEAKRLDEIKDVRDLAVAAKAYAKQRGLGLEVQNQAAEIRLVAERRMGEILAASKKNRGAAGNPGGRGAPIVRDPGRTAHPPTYREIGIGKKEAIRAQLFARIQTEAFDLAIEALKVLGEEVSVARVRAMARLPVEAVFLALESLRQADAARASDDKAALEALVAAGRPTTVEDVRQALVAARRNVGDPAAPQGDAGAGAARGLLRRARGLILRARESAAISDWGKAKLGSAVQLVDEAIREIAG